MATALVICILIIILVIVFKKKKKVNSSNVSLNKGPQEKDQLDIWKTQTSRSVSLKAGMEPPKHINNSQSDYMGNDCQVDIHNSSSSSLST